MKFDLAALKWLLPYFIVFAVGIFAGGGSISYTSGDAKLELRGRQQEKLGLQIQVENLKKRLEVCK